MGESGRVVQGATAGGKHVPEPGIRAAQVVAVVGEGVPAIRRNPLVVGENGIIRRLRLFACEQIQSKR